MTHGQITSPHLEDDPFPLAKKEIAHLVALLQSHLLYLSGELALPVVEHLIDHLASPALKVSLVPIQRRLQSNDFSYLVHFANRPSTFSSRASSVVPYLQSFEALDVLLIF